ncbi:sigma-70 family RNA polymerase sigma factor [Candidatus Poribacteria bacterium]|nr:sigma-70 family RNA polymerase sigma factor [Candidatus Poribacteria bacterium]
MEKDDVQLIRRTLSGDDAAFSTLVQKYRKSVHALAWRKIGDFHYAEEITQDTFLQAYKKLSTLKDPNQFAGWLYVIVSRLCLNWIRKKKPTMQSLDGTSTEEIEKFSYIRYVSEQRETETSERRSEIVKKLLARLPESERTVVTLYYLGEMNAKEIGKFLGVSVKTIHSRLHRARKRLQEKEELLVSDVLGSVQLPTRLTENIMQQVADLKPTPPPVGKPLLPWAAFGAAAVLVILLLGMSNQYITRFQKPYSFEAQSEPTIEIIDAAIVLNVDSQPAVRRQVGRAAIPSENRGIGQQITETVLASNIQEDSAKFSTSQWTQTNRPHGGTVLDLFATSESVVYAAAPTGIYRLAPDATAWTRINTSIPSGPFRMPMAEYGDTLYIVSTDKIFASTNNGEKWKVLCSRPEGHAVGLIVKNEADDHTPQSRSVMYIALQDEGIFRSTDAGAQWNLLENGPAAENVYAVTAIGNTVFAGTNKGLYRLNSDVWERLSVHPSQQAILSLTVFENNLYAVTGPAPSRWKFLESNENTENIAVQIHITDSPSLERVFHSIDLGASWTEVTLGNESPFRSTALGVVVLTHTGETLLPQGVVTADKNTFYKSGSFGIYRTTDGGKSWHPFANGITETTIQDLVTVNNRLYARTDRGIVQSVDGGEVWETVEIDSPKQTREGIEEEFSPLHFSLASQLETTGDVLYGIAPGTGNLRLFQLSVGDNTFVPVQRAPTFERELSSIDLEEWTGELKQELLSDNSDENEDFPAVVASLIKDYSGIGGFAVSGQTFYAEWKHRLFRWKPGDSEWTDTGLIDTSESFKDRFDRGFKLAASGETVYVGKRDGKLFQSLDEGNSWKDVTPILPLRFTGFKEIVFAGSRVYVATDEGVLASQNGEHWRVLTDEMGERPVIDRFAVDHTNVYGAGNVGVYHLDDRGRWDQISPSVPDVVSSLVVSNDKLYIVTQHGRMFHIPLQEL